MSSLAPRLTVFFGVTSAASLRSLDDLAKLSRCFSTLVRISSSSPSTSSYPSTNAAFNVSEDAFLAASGGWPEMSSSLHTSVFDRLRGVRRTIDFDLVPQEPRNPEEWEFRYVRYGKSQKEWRKHIPMGVPDLDAIPEGHVDRNEKPYTTQALPWNYTMGRDENKKRSNHRVGEGVRRFYRMLDLTRNVPLGENSPFIERVLDVIDDETRNPFIALVANGDFKRYILASENMKPGDLVKTYNEIPRNPVQAFEGDAYPIGALAVGTIIHNLEKVPGKGGEMETTAGSYGTILRKEGDRVIVSLYRKKKSRALVHNKEVSVDERCMATVGRVSNVNYHLIPIGNATMLRKLGFRSRSGLWQRKDGRYGRRIRPPPPVEEITEPPRPYIPIYKEK